jgi:hypothetical protein
VIPTVTTAGLRHYRCIKIDGLRWLQHDLSQQCYDTDWDVLAVWAVLAVLQAVLLPLFMLVVLRRSSRTGPYFDDYLSFWTDGLKAHAFWFEPMRLLRKTTLVFIAIVLSTGEQQACVAIILTTSSMILTSLAQPYKTNWICTVDTIGQFVIIVCLVTALGTFSPRIGVADESSQVLAGVFIVVLCSSWACFLLVLLFRHHHRCCGGRLQHRKTAAESQDTALSLDEPLLLFEDPSLYN